MAKFDVLTIGNAIVDIIARTNDDFLVDNGIVKGAMNLVDASRAQHLYSKMKNAIETSGGSAANTAAAIASLGGKVAYMGKVANDELGGIFAHDIRSQGVHYDTMPLENGNSTARSMIFITPDGERSMNTYLGACIDFGPEDIEAEKIEQAKIIYFEGYLWDPPRAKEAMRLAAKIAHNNDHKMALTLSDAFCVERYRDEFLELIRKGTVDIIFANESEVLSLYNTKSLDTALMAIGNDVKGFSCITCAEKGAVIVEKKTQIIIPPYPVDKVLDATGAGDAFAAGFLYGHSNQMSFEKSGRLGTFCATQVLQQIGPRSPFSLHDLAAKAGIM